MGMLEAIDQQAYLGTDFLTWLWFRAETGSGQFELPEIGAFDVEVDTVVSAVADGEADVRRVALKGDAPGASRLLKQAVAEGKLLERAALRVVWENIAWSATVDARTLDLGGVKLPVAAPQGGGVLTEHYRLRLDTLEGFLDLWDALFGYYLALRLDADAWATESGHLATWLAEDLSEAAI